MRNRDKVALFAVLLTSLANVAIQLFLPLTIYAFFGHLINALVGVVSIATFFTGKLPEVKQAPAATDNRPGLLPFGVRNYYDCEDYIKSKYGFSDSDMDDWFNFVQHEEGGTVEELSTVTVSDKWYPNNDTRVRILRCFMDEFGVLYDNANHDKCRYAMFFMYF